MPQQLPALAEFADSPLLPLGLRRPRSRPQDSSTRRRRRYRYRFDVLAAIAKTIGRCCIRLRLHLLPSQAAGWRSLWWRFQRGAAVDVTIWFVGAGCSDPAMLSLAQHH